MKKPITLFRCLVARTNKRRFCDHSNKHAIQVGELYVQTGTRRGQKAPICLQCGREMILAAHEQLNALMQTFERQELGMILQGVHVERAERKRRSNGPRRMFKCEVKRADGVCDLCKGHHIQHGELHCVFVTYTGREISLCCHCAQATVMSAQEQLQAVMQALDQ